MKTALLWLSWASCLLGCSDGVLDAFDVVATSSAGSAAVPSSGGAAGSSSGSGGNGAELPATLLIDDFADGNTRGVGDTGYWYVVNDRSGSQSFGIEPAAGGRSGSAMRTQGSDFSDWGAALGLNLLGPGQVVFDASAFGELRFWARAEVGSSSEVSVELLNLEHVHFVQPIVLASDWQEMSLPLAAFLGIDDPVAVDPARLEAIQLFFVSGEPFDIWIDDMMLVR